MELELKNIGRIEKANIKIDGITVICGDNNTGKSTVGKMLYAVYQSFYDIQGTLERERGEAYRNILNRTVRELDRRTDFKKTRWSLGQLKELDEIAVPENEEAVKEKVREILNGLFEDVSPENLESVTNRILAVTKQSEKDILQWLLKNYLKAEFGSRIGNVNYPRRKSDVKLDFREGCIHFQNPNGTIEPVLSEHINIRKKLVYIDDPFLLDNLDYHPFFLRNTYYHRTALQQILVEGSAADNSTIIEEMMTAQRLKPILERFDSVLSGSLAIKEGAIKYKSAKYKAELDLVSVSTGIKSFIILKELLMNGSIEENGIIVIDEPEVHLHPEWQVRYAEIIVMLQKYYGLNIILTTHSDEFLSAIQLYSKRYGVEETCHYYMAKLKPSKTADDLPLSCFEESTRDLEEIYASLSQPYLDVYSQLNEEE